MKPVALCLVAFLACSAFAGVSINVGSDDDSARIGPRRNVSAARTSLTSRDGSTAILLTNDLLVVQLTDKALARIDSERSSEDHDRGLVEQIFAAMVVSGVRLMLGKAIEYPIAEIRSVEYRNNQLLITNNAGEPIFRELEINDVDVMSSFAATDANRFSASFRAIKAAQRR
jgi:hypothetical protein